MVNGICVVKVHTIPLLFMIREVMIVNAKHVEMRGALVLFALVCVVSSVSHAMPTYVSKESAKEIAIGYYITVNYFI